MVGRNIKALFLQEKPVKTLLTLKRFGEPSYPAVISKEIESTYAHTWRVILTLKELGLVRFEKKGRIKLVKLSELGSSIASEFENLQALLEVAEADAAIESIYQRKVKGRLRVQINRERVLNRLRLQAKRLEKLAGSKNEEIWKHVRKCLGRIEEIEREVTGLIVG